MTKQLKSTPLTLELFQEVLMPQIRLLVSDSVKKEVKSEVTKVVRSELKRYPTREQYYTREDKTMAELKKLRDEVAMTNDLYHKTNKRVDKIDKHLGIDTSTVF